MSRVLAIIPARGGSKEIPRKNLVPVADKPLIAWTILCAVKSGVFSDVVVSTDDEEIADVARDYGADVPFLRPEEYAQDNSSTESAMIHERHGCHD